jgi:hypothetical protein
MYRPDAPRQRYRQYPRRHSIRDLIEARHIQIRNHMSKIGLDRFRCCTL